MCACNEVTVKLASTDYVYIVSRFYAV